jgi:hypothetical protein
MRASRVVVALVLTAAVTGCGSSGGSTSGATSSSTTGPNPAATTDRRIAAAGVLRAADLPGWKMTPRGTSRGSELKDIARGVPGCEPLVTESRDGRARARSAKFARNGTVVDDDVDVYATAAEMQAQLELYRDPAIIGCLQDLFTKTLQSTAPAGATVDAVSVSPIAVDASADGAYGFRLSATVTRDGVARTILSDVIGVTVGRAGISFSVDAPDTAGLAQAETTLLPVLVQRVRQAQA